MPTRRDFLQSALLLPAALTQTGKPTHAQAPPTPNTQHPTPTFDFEGGNYDGWTIEGDAFGVAPATESAFPGRIRGFTGRGFLCSLHQKKGNAATGKAISKEFTIEKPFLTFKIGGGNHPNQACLNLIVDNQIVRTATGDGTASLSESSFDVSEFVGRKAHIEIVDATASTDRGYIMVDDIRFTDKIQYKGFGWRDKTIEPFFITRAKIWQGIDFRNGESPFPFELPESDIQRAIDRVVVAMHEPDMTLPPVAERSVERIGAQIVRKVDATIAAMGLPKVNKFTRQWLLAEGVCEWVRLNVYYDTHLEQVSGDEGVRNAEPNTIIGKSEPGAVCFGFAWLTRDIARATGLKCDAVNGTFRGLLNPAPNGPNHSVACFILNGLEIPADVSGARGTYARLGVPGVRGLKFVTGKKVAERYVLPRRAETWELFLAGFFPREDSVQTAFDVQGKHKLLLMGVEQWKEYNPRYLIPLAEKIEIMDVRG